MKVLNIFMVILATLLQNSVANVIRGFVQTNIVGLPLIHEHQTFTFDPDVSKRRRRQFQELHGWRGEKLIERIGLGIDGYDEARLKSQRARDEGHLQGRDYITPPFLD